MRSHLGRLLSEKNWTPLITVPVIGFLMFGLIPASGLLLLNSRSWSLGCTFLAILLVPFILSKIHAVDFKKIYAIWIVVIAINAMTMPSEWEGNPKLAMQDHFLPGIFFALVLSMFFLILAMAKKANS